MKINFLGKFYDNHSLSIVNRNIVIQLEKLFKDTENELFITPLDSFDQKYKLDLDLVKELKHLQNKDFSMEDADIEIRHSYPPIWRWPISNKTKILYIQAWEFSKIPTEWQYKFETFVDGLIVPSKWTGIRFLDAGLNPEKLFILPNGVNTKIFNSENRQNNNKLTFIYVGNSQYRKGIDILLNAWARVFKKVDKVKLIIKDNPNIYGETNLLNEIIAMQYKTGCAEIEYIDADLTDLEMANLYKSSNILVHPFRGEGFGMHIQEAMACGCYPLISANGAPSDFVNENIGSFIKTNKKLVNLSEDRIFAVKPGDSLSPMQQHGWIEEPDIEDLCKNMYHIYNYSNPKYFQEKVSKVNIFTWTNVAEDLLGILEDLDKRDNIPFRIKK